MQFVDLKAQHERIGDQIRNGIDTVLEHGRFIMGPEVAELELRLAEWVGVKHAISCSSGTDALLMPLMAQGVGPGDAVFTTTFSFIATAEVISLLGATPVFVDIDAQTFNIDPAKLKRAIEAVKKNDSTLHPLPEGTSALVPKAVIPVDIFGLPADYDAITEVAEQENLFVLEDAAQGLGGIYKGKRAGSLAHAGATSFFPAKPLGCYGDGGAIFTDDDELAETIKSIRIHGKGTEKYDNVRVGLNGRLDTMQAAILLPKLEIFPEELKARDRIAGKYSDLLTEKNNGIIPQHIPPGLTSAWAQYSILVDNRQKIVDGLREAGIPSMIYYAKGLHEQKAYESLGYRKEDFEVTAEITGKVLSLPMHPYLADSDLERIVQCFHESMEF